MICLSPYIIEQTRDEGQRHLRKDKLAKERQERGGDPTLEIRGICQETSKTQLFVTFSVCCSQGSPITPKRKEKTLITLYISLHNLLIFSFFMLLNRCFFNPLLDALNLSKVNNKLKIILPFARISPTNAIRAVVNTQIFFKIQYVH